MKFPKGEVKHQNLSTAYTNLVALLSTLKSEGFSGTLDVEFPGSRGVLFLVSGEVVNAEAIRTSDQKETDRTGSCPLPFGLVEPKGWGSECLPVAAGESLHDGRQYSTMRLFSKDFPRISPVSIVSF